MPSATAFKKGFSLAEGVAIPGTEFAISAVSCGHEPITVNEKYNFPIVVDLAPKSAHIKVDSASLTTALRKWFVSEGELRRIYSEYGSPYDCSVHNIKISSVDPKDGTVTVKATGTAVRDHEAPTLKALTEEQEKGHPQVSEAERSAVEKTHRVIKSHFATGTCASCDAGIQPGQEIARPKRADESGSHGGWGHLSCVVGSHSHSSSSSSSAAAVAGGQPQKQMRKTSKQSKKQSKTTAEAQSLEFTGEEGGGGEDVDEDEAGEMTKAAGTDTSAGKQHKKAAASHVCFEGPHTAPKAAEPAVGFAPQPKRSKKKKAQPAQGKQKGQGKVKGAMKASSSGVKRKRPVSKPPSKHAAAASSSSSTVSRRGEGQRSATKKKRAHI